MRVVDLFCGAGGFSLGMHQAGYGTVGAFDYEPSAVAVHAANHRQVSSMAFLDKHKPPLRRSKPTTCHADLHALLEWVPQISQLRPDVIVGGPPCQPWSTNGDRLGDADERAILTVAFAVITAAVRPRYFIMENVPELQKSETFLKVTTIFRNAGYGLTVRMLSTNEFGSVQNRKRLIVAGCADETDGWFNEYLNEARQDEPILIRDVLGSDFGPVLFRRGHYKGERRSFFRTDESCPTITSTFSRGNTGAYKLRPADLPILGSLGEDIAFLGKGRNYRPKAGDLIPAHRLPIPTVQQLGVLAGFPREYQWAARYTPPAKEGAKRTPRPKSPNKTEILQMIGNAVPPPFARTLGECIRNHHRGRMSKAAAPAVPVHEEFYEWLRDTKKLDDRGVESVRRLADKARQLIAARELDDPQEELKAFDKIANSRWALKQDPELQAMRDAMRLVYECAMSLNGVSLDGEPDVNDYEDNFEDEDILENEYYGRRSA